MKNTSDAPAPFAAANGSGSAGIAEGFLSGPWYVVLYLITFMLFCELNWKVGVGWLLWRMAHTSRIAWEEREEKRKSQNDPDQRPGKKTTQNVNMQNNSTAERTPGSLHPACYTARPEAHSKRSNIWRWRVNRLRRLMWFENPTPLQLERIQQLERAV